MCKWLAGHAPLSDIVGGGGGVYTCSPDYTPVYPFSLFILFICLSILTAYPFSLSVLSVNPLSMSFNSICVNFFSYFQFPQSIRSLCLTIFSVSLFSLFNVSAYSMLQLHFCLTRDLSGKLFSLSYNR